MRTILQTARTLSQPRWRLALCPDEHPQRTARRLLMNLRRDSPERTFVCTECHEGLGLALVAVHQGPVGACLTDPDELPEDLPNSWANAQDRSLTARGYAPGVLLALKQAASQARVQHQDTVLNRYLLVPLPHLPGEMLVRHPSGWEARALAWWQNGALLALAWCEPQLAKLRRAC